jgi:hypothetical protein
MDWPSGYHSRHRDPIPLFALVRARHLAPLFELEASAFPGRKLVKEDEGVCHSCSFLPQAYKSFVGYSSSSFFLRSLDQTAILTTKTPAAKAARMRAENNPPLPKPICPG